jgi:hypothetical protein
MDDHCPPQAVLGLLFDTQSTALIEDAANNTKEDMHKAAT